MNTSGASPASKIQGEILRTLVQHNRLAVAGSGLFPCAGVYAVVTSASAIRIGDEVSRS